MNKKDELQAQLKSKLNERSKLIKAKAARPEDILKSITKVSLEINCIEKAIEDLTCGEQIG